MKKPVILAIITVLLISFSIVFYYKNVDFTKENSNFEKKENLVDELENEKQENVQKEGKKEESWFSKLLKQEEEKKEQPVEEVKSPEKDLTNCNENGKIMIVMYHKFAETANDVWTRTFKQFEEDLTLLYEKNYYPINLTDYINGYIDVPYGKTPVILTFDDGLDSQMSFTKSEGKLVVKENTAVGIYKKFNEAHPDFPMRGTFYIMSTNFFGSTGTLRERLEYLTEQGFEIGNQTKNHTPLAGASKEKITEEVGGLAKFVDELIPGYVINSFSIPGGSMTKNYPEAVYSGEYKGFKYENKGIVLLYGSKPEVSPIDNGLNLKQLSRVRVSGKDKISNDFNYWVDYFEEHPEEKFISDGDPNVFVINSTDKDNVTVGSLYNLKVK